MKVMPVLSGSGYAIPKVHITDYINHIYMMTCVERRSTDVKRHINEGNVKCSLLGKKGVHLLAEIHAE